MRAPGVRMAVEPAPTTLLLNQQASPNHGHGGGENHRNARKDECDHGHVFHRDEHVLVARRTALPGVPGVLPAGAPGCVGRTCKLGAPVIEPISRTIAHRSGRHSPERPLVVNAPARPAVPFSAPPVRVHLGEHMPVIALVLACVPVILRRHRDRGSDWPADSAAA